MLCLLVSVKMLESLMSGRDMQLLLKLNRITTHLLLSRTKAQQQV
jgi:hypothetical protein